MTSVDSPRRQVGPVRVTRRLSRSVTELRQESQSGRDVLTRMDYYSESEDRTLDRVRGLKDTQGQVSKSY